MKRKTLYLCNLCLSERADGLPKGTLVRVVVQDECDTKLAVEQALPTSPPRDEERPG